MKVSSVLTSLFLARFAVGETDRELHQNSIVLNNGAELSVDISKPKIGTKFGLTQADSEGLVVSGTVHMGKAVPDVTYIYVIDSSGSTSEDDGACGSTLQCVQTFFRKLHNEIVLDGSAKFVAVVDFDYDATVNADLQEPSPHVVDDFVVTIQSSPWDQNSKPNNDLTDAANGLVSTASAAAPYSSTTHTVQGQSSNSHLNGNPHVAAINSGHSDGDTMCAKALEAAAKLVKDPRNKARKTVVIFAGDGECTDSWDVPEAADHLGETGAIVHSIAVGDNIDCDHSAGSQSLSQIPRNGGECFSIPDPNTLSHIIDEVKIGTTLKSIDLKLDGVVQQQDFVTSKALPQVGLTDIDFETTIHVFGKGSHEICIVAGGQDLLDDQSVSVVDDCHTVEVVSDDGAATSSTTPALKPSKNPPTPNPTPSPTPRLKLSTASGSSPPKTGSESLNKGLIIALATGGIIVAALAVTLLMMRLVPRAQVNDPASVGSASIDLDVNSLTLDEYPQPVNPFQDGQPRVGGTPGARKLV